MPVLDKVSVTMSPHMSSMLNENFHREEIVEALKQMHPTNVCVIFTELLEYYWR